MNERPYSSIDGAPLRKLLRAINTMKILFLVGVRNGRIASIIFKKSFI